MDADASASFELDSDPLTAGLDGIAAKFEAVASQINASFTVANAQITQTGVAAGTLATGTPAATGFAQGLYLAAQAAQLVTIAVSGIVTTVARLIPFLSYVPNSLGAWVPALKGVVGQYEKLISTVSLLRAGVQAMQGRLSLMNAAFTAFGAASSGVFSGLAARLAQAISLHSGLIVQVKTVERALVLLGTAGALAFSRMISTARGVIGLIGKIGPASAAAARGVGALAGAFHRAATTAAMILVPVAGLALALGPVGAAALGVAGAFGLVAKSIAAAAEVQSLQTSFVTLLGSADAAQTRIAELSKFAATTPFDIPGVVKVSKVLETLTRGALSTGAGLRMVGDAAAVAQEPFDQLAIHIGRLYDGLQNGRPVGEAMARLQELGLISSSTRAQIEAMQASGQKGDAVWNVAAAALGRFSGEMKRQSGTWQGLMSNLSDTIGNLYRAFGAPLITSLSPFLDKLVSYLGTLTGWAEKAGSIFAGWAGLLAQAFASGRLTEILTLVGQIAVMKWRQALLASAAAFGAGLDSVARNIGAMLSGVTAGAFKGAGSLLRAAALDFGASILEAWHGLTSDGVKDLRAATVSALAAAAVKFGDLFLNGIKAALEAMKAFPGLGRVTGDAIGSVVAAMEKNARAVAALFSSPEAGSKAAQGMRSAAANERRDAAGAFAAARESVRNPFEGVWEVMQKAFAAAQENLGKGSLDTSSLQSQLHQALSQEWAKYQATLKAAGDAARAGGLPAPPDKPGDPNSSTGAKGKSGSDVAALQRIGGGGGFSVSKADPLLAETKTQTKVAESTLKETVRVRELLERQGRQTVAEPVFG